MRSRSIAFCVSILLGSLVTVSAPAVGQILNPDNGHYYEFVPTPPHFKWTEAKAAAEARTFTDPGGAVLQGYLATVTSQEEEDFLQTHFGTISFVWIGGSDAAVEGDWRWVTGPEGLEDGGQGRLFWRGGPGGTAFGFSNWTAGEPNSEGDEDYMDWNHSGKSGWNDSLDQPFPERPAHVISGYLVECSEPDSDGDE